MSGRREILLFLSAPPEVAREELRQAQQDSMTQSYTEPNRPPKPA